MKTTSKRITAIVTAAVTLTVCMVFDVPERIAAAAEETHSHKLCGGTEHDGCTHGDIEFQPLTYTFTDDKPQWIIRGQNVYLTSDIEMPDDGRLFVEKGVTNLCLNGYSIKKNGDEIIDMNNIGGEYAELNICDCKGGGGIVNTSVSGEEDLSCIAAIDNVTLNVYGGTIDGGKSAAAIDSHKTTGQKGGDVNIYGGEIKAEDGCGIYLFDDANASLSVYGGEITSGENGYSIYSRSSGNTVTVCGGNISGTIRNNSDSTLKIEDGNVSSTQYFAIDNYGLFDLSGGSISSSGSDSTIENCGTINITGGSVSGDVTYEIINYKGTVTISGGTVEGSKYLLWNKTNASADIKGGELIGENYDCFWNNGTLSISGGEIKCLGYPLKNYGILNISGGSIKHKNFSGTRNYIQNYGTFNLSASPTFENTDFWLRSNDNIGIAGELTYNTPCTVYIDSNVPRIFTSGWNTYMSGRNVSDYFKSPYSLCTVAESEDEAILRVFKITFDANGGECGTQDTDVNDYGKVSPLPEATWQGYTFDGWFTEAENGEEVTVDTVFTSDTTIYAHWTKNVCEHNWSTEWSNDDTNHWHECLNGCGEKNGESEHTWNDGIITKEPTEAAKGEKTFTCTACNTTKTETLPKLDHVHALTYHERVDADCVNDGTVEYWSCSKCGKNYSDAAATNQLTDITISAKKHTVEIDAAVEATCTTDGKTEGSHCSVCDTVLTAQTTIPAKGHSWDNGVVTTPATEDSEGVKTFTCSVCKKVETKPIPKLDHVHTLTFHAKVDADCENDGTVEYWSCSKCGNNYSDAAATQQLADTTIPAKGHIWDNGVVTTEPTASTDGEKTYTCTICGVTKTEKIPATGGTNPPSGNENGNITTEVQQGENVPATEVKTPKDELIDAVLTAEEKEQTNNGVDIKIILKVEDGTDTVPAEDKANVEKKIGELPNYKLGQYLDVELLKIIGSVQEKITNTTSNITVTFDLPEALRETSRTYSVIRVHDGITEVLPDLDNDVNTVTIETDKFSTYALAYSEKSENTPPSGGNSDGSNPTTPTSYRITVNANEGGYVSGSGDYNHGDIAEISAAPDNGYKFVGWYEDGTLVSTSLNYSFTVRSSRTFMAKFEVIDDTSGDDNPTPPTSDESDPNESGDTSTDSNDETSGDETTQPSDDNPSTNESGTNTSDSTSSGDKNNSAPSESAPSDNGENPATGIAVSCLPLATAVIILTVAAKRKKK